MKDVDVAISDFLLTIQCWAFALMLSNLYLASVEGRFVIAIFGFVGLSALTGGVVHGFYHRMSSVVVDVLWRLTLLGIVLCSCMLWLLAGKVFNLFEPFLAVAMVLLLIHAIAIAINPQFLVAIISYAPAVMAVLLAFFFEWQAAEQGAGWVCLGFAVTLIAPVVQVLKIDLHPRYLTFNTFYHIIQAVALSFVYVGCHSWLQVTIIT